MRHSFASLLTLSLASLAACGSDTTAPSPVDVRSHITSDLGNVLDETSAAAGGLRDVMPSTTALAFLQTALGGSATSSIASAARRIAPEMGLDGAPLVDSQAVIDALTTQVFTDENEIEPGLYDVPASLGCMGIESDGNGTTTEVLDAACVETWNAIDPRVRVETSGTGLRFAVQLGAHHDEPLGVTLTHDSLAISLDLEEAQDAASAIAAALGEDFPNASLHGKITGSLTVLGTAHAEADLTFDRAIDIAFAADGISLTSPDAVHFATAASHVLHVGLDGHTGLGMLALALGTTTAHVPSADVGTLDLDLPAATATVAVADGAITLTNVSLGDRTTKLLHDGVVALAIDLNAADGRTLSANVTTDSVGGALLEVSPKLDLQVAIDRVALDAQTARYDVTRVHLDGSLASTADDDRVRVAAGTFAITTSPAQYGFSATANQCVAGATEVDETTFESYVVWTVDACN